MTNWKRKGASALRRRILNGVDVNRNLGRPATARELRDAIERRLMYLAQWQRDEFSKRFPRHSDADTLFEGLYALSWCAAWKRPLSDWRGFVVDETATQLALNVSV